MPVVERTRAARRDLMDIWRYLDREATTEVANAQLLRIEYIAERLAAMPYSAQARPELGRGIRSRRVGSYVLYFAPLPDGIEILRVLHGRRDVRPDMLP
ncbi:MAG: type II toxin-antitoxin system RelE/ParE family toxin [Bacteroidota bacterium]